jgi:hypothetical protein
MVEDQNLRVRVSEAHKSKSGEFLGQLLKCLNSGPVRTFRGVMAVHTVTDGNLYPSIKRGLKLRDE